MKLVSAFDLTIHTDTGCYRYLCGLAIEAIESVKRIANSDSEFHKCELRIGKFLPLESDTYRHPVPPVSEYERIFTDSTDLIDYLTKQGK